MSTGSCILTDCLDYYTIYNSCVIQYPASQVSQEKCICTPTAIQGYIKCYPCVTSLPTTTGPILPIANYTATCSAANSGGGYTFSGFPGLPTTTRRPTTTLKYPVPSGSGGSGTGSGSGSSGNNSNSGSSDNGSSNTGLYIGIGAGVAVLVLGIALFFWHRHRKNKKSSTKTTELPSPPPMQAVHNQHQQPPQPPLPAVPVHYNYTPAPTQTEYHHQQQYQNHQQQTNQYQQQYQEQQQNQYTPPTVVPQQQQQYTTQPPVATNYYAQAQGGGGGYPDPNAYADPNQQQHQGYYPTVSNVSPLPQPVPSPTFTPNDYYQQQQHNTFSPIVTTSGITHHQEPMLMPEQPNPHYGTTSPSATNTTAYSPAITTTNTTAYEAPATTGFAYEAPASIVPPPVPAAANNNIKVSSHGPQEIHAYSQEQAAAGLPKNPQYVDPQHNNGNNYHN